jgi:hypothetical protein
MVMLFKSWRVTTLQHSKFTKKTPSRHICRCAANTAGFNNFKGFNSHKFWTTSPQPKFFDNIKKVICLRTFNYRSNHFAVFHSLRFRIIRHIFKNANQMHNIHPLHVFTVLLLHVSVFLTPLSGRILCPLLKTTCYFADTSFDHVKAKQSRYRPGVAQRVSRS